MYNSDVAKTLLRVPEPSTAYQAWLIQINPPKKTKPVATDPPVEVTGEDPSLEEEPIDDVPLDETETPIKWGFLLPPQSISYTVTSEYIEKNPLFGRIPYVRFNHVKALKITLSNVRLVTPCSAYDVLPLITSLQELMYPPEYIKPPDAETPIDEQPDDGEDTTEEQIRSFYARFPSGYPQGYPGQNAGTPGQTFPGSEQMPSNTQFPGGMGLPGGQQGTPGGQQGTPGGNGNTEIPVEEETPDIEEEADKELEEDIEGAEPIEDPRIVDPPMLSLVLGNRTIQPIRLMSLQVNETELTNGFPTDVTLTMEFIAITHPVLYQKAVMPEDITGDTTTNTTDTNNGINQTQNNNLTRNNTDPFQTLPFPSF